MNFLELKSIEFLPSGLQVFIITGLFILTTWYQYLQFKKTGKVFDNYPVGIWILFAPITEEIIFRGFLLSYFSYIWTLEIAIVVSCLLFGIWHFKNIFWEGKQGVIRQILYAGFVAGPIFVIITLLTGSIWPAVIAHYLHNLIAVSTRKFFIK
jgi:membrane protease YdiL (CAAX protease family)